MFRIKGGTRQLVAALGLGLDQERVRLGHAVSSLAATEAGVPPRAVSWWLARAHGNNEMSALVYR